MPISTNRGRSCSFSSTNRQLPSRHGLNSACGGNSCESRRASLLLRLATPENQGSSNLMPDADETIYSVRNEQERFTVVDESNRTIVVCHDKANADQYVSLLNEAFRKGFKAGRRAARQAGTSTS